jgi:hypothetical protein
LATSVRYEHITPEDCKRVALRCQPALATAQGSWPADWRALDLYCANQDRPSSSPDTHRTGPFCRLDFEGVSAYDGSAEDRKPSLENRAVPHLGHGRARNDTCGYVNTGLPPATLARRKSTGQQRAFPSLAEDINKPPEAATNNDYKY